MAEIEGEGLLREPLAAVNAMLAAHAEMRTTLPLAAPGSWETFCAAVTAAYVDPPLALATMHAALAALHDRAPDSFTNPPIASYALWQVYQMTAARDLLEAYPLLLRWHNWWQNFRDGNHNKLFNWASAAETGMPEHPLYADAEVDPHTGVLMLDDVGLTSLWALDAFALMRMALTLDDLDNATHLENEILSVAELMNLTFWDPDRGIYRSQDWFGLPMEYQSLTVLLALPGRIPTGQRLPRLLDEHLAQEFAAPYLLPTLGAGDDAYHEQRPWRGRVSPVLNFLIAAGLRYFQADAWAERITLSGLELLRRSWAQGQVFASYNAETGAGDDIPQDDRSLVGTLLGTLGVQMLFEAEAWDGLRLGNLAGADMAVANLPYRDKRYTVTTGPWGLKALRNGRPWLSVDRPAIIRNLLETDREVSLQLRTAADTGRVTVRVHGYPPGSHVSLKINGSVARLTVDKHGMLERTLALPLPTPGVSGRAAA
jgi:hypothetical protein